MYYIANKALPKPSKLVTDIGDGTDASNLVGEGSRDVAADVDASNLVGEGSRDVAADVAAEQLLLRGGSTWK